MKHAILVVSDILSERDTYAGRHRIEGLCKAWARLGHDVHVLTPGPIVPRMAEGCTYHVSARRSARFWRRYPRLYALQRRARRRILRAVCFPDAGIVWYRSALGHADRIVRDHGIDLVFSSFSSATSHVVAAGIAERHGLRWIADYRDIWSDNVYHEAGQVVPLYLHRGRQPSRARWRRHRALEQAVLARATCVTAVSEAMTEVVREKVGPAVPIRVVPNGYDDDQVATGDAPRDAFVVGYTGKLNNGHDHRELRMFLRSLRAVAGEHPEARGRLRFRFRGHEKEAVRRLCAAEAPDVPADIGGARPFDECVALQRDASVLLLMLPLDTGRSRGIAPRKLFDYLAARRPILALTPPESQAAEIVERTKAGVVATSEAEVTEALRRQLRELLREGRIRYEPDEAALREYSFSELAPRVLSAVPEQAGRAAGRYGKAGKDDRHDIAT